MKKLMYFAAALLVLVGCNNKDNALNNAPEGAPFKKGQQVTLTVGTGNNANQVTPRKVAGTDNGTQINFTWEEGDKILVKVGDKTAEFTLTTGAGNAEGEFAGTMPADGSTFDIQFPVNAPDLSAQVYSEDKAIPADKIAFAAEGCTLDADAFLEAKNAMVQLNLYGTDKTVGKIVFTNKTANPAVSYTLTCTGGKTIAATSTEATPFYMVVPAGTYQFEAEIWDNATTSAKICSFATSAAKTFTAGKCLNMPAKEVKAKLMHNGHEYVDLGLPSGLKWATCNVGATAPEGYGDYFAWGETETKDVYLWSTCFDTNDGGQTFIKYNNNGGKTTLEPEDDAAHVNWGGSWRMPTKEECNELVTNCKWAWTEDYNGTGIKGYIVTSKAEGNTNSIFLPVTGYRIDQSLNYLYVGEGYYWSSSLRVNRTDFAHYLGFAWDYVEASTTTYSRCYGYPVRPVCQ